MYQPYMSGDLEFYIHCTKKCIGFKLQPFWKKYYNTNYRPDSMTGTDGHTGPLVFLDVTMVIAVVNGLKIERKWK